MTEKLITTDTILSTLHEWFENKQPVSPEVLVDSAYKLNILVGDDQAHLFNLQQQVAQLRVMHMEKGDNGVRTKAEVEASDLYKAMLMQKAKIERIHEHVRIAKLHARLSNEERKGY